MVVGEPNGLAIATGEGGSVAPLSATIDRADGVDDVVSPAGVLRW